MCGAGGRNEFQWKCFPCGRLFWWEISSGEKILGPGRAREKREEENEMKSKQDSKNSINKKKCGGCMLALAPQDRLSHRPARFDMCALCAEVFKNMNETVITPYNLLFFVARRAPRDCIVITSLGIIHVFVLYSSRFIIRSKSIRRRKRTVRAFEFKVERKRTARASLIINDVAASIIKDGRRGRQRSR